MSDLDHLHPSAKLLLDLPPKERKAKAETKRWIPYPLARQGYTKMQRLLDMPRQQRPENLLVTAPTNNGKSMLLERFAETNPARDDEEGDHAVVPVLLIEMPEDPTVEHVYYAILSKLFAPINTRSTRANRRKELFDLLRLIKPKVLLVDEVHNLELAGSAERLKILALLRTFGNDPDLRMSVVCAGTEEARRMLHSDPQLLNRFDLHRLPIWRDGDAYRELLASFESLLPLRRPSYLGEDDALAGAILSMSQGLIGEMFKILSRAAVLAIDSGDEAIGLKTLSKIDYQSPKAKRVEVEDLPL